MSPPVLLLQGIALTFGGTPLLTAADLGVGPGERVALVGRNGSGKSTLLKIAAGSVEADSGQRFLQPSATLRYLSQEPDLSGFSSVSDYVAAGLAPGDDPHRARELLESLGLRADLDPAILSGGEARRAALARALAPDPDILLLDEPTNHLDIAAIEYLEATLRAVRAAFVLVSHDRRFLETLSTATVWLDRGTTRRLDQGFAGFESWRDRILEEEELENHKLNRTIVREEHWLRYGVTARRKRNQGRLRALAGLRVERQRRRSNAPTGLAQLAAQEAQQSGKLVIEAKGIGKSFGERAIVRDFSIRIERGDRLGLLGPNGAGKTTLINLLTGALTPDSGSVRLGTNLEVGSLDQGRRSLDPNRTVADMLTDGRGDSVIVNGQSRHVIGYMRDFLFRPEQARTPIGTLSGGERGRLMLARALARPSNLLVLDEPTNDLDLETLDLLEEFLAGYPGTLLLVSHDRDFVDRVATAVLVCDGDGRWIEYAGGYSDMIAQRGRGIGAPMPAAPARAKPPAAKPVARAGMRRKLTFADQHAMETLPKEIERLTAEMRRLEELLADTGLYRRDPRAFASATAALAEARAKATAAEDEWLRIELLREEIARSG